MAKRSSLRNKQQNKRRDAEDELINLIDSVTEIEDLAPWLKRDMNREGMTPEKLREKWRMFLTAQQINDAVTSGDPKIRQAARKDLMDRAEGTAVSRSQETHKFEEMEEKQLDALLKTKLKGLKPSKKLKH